MYIQINIKFNIILYKVIFKHNNCKYVKHIILQRMHHDKFIQTKSVNLIHGCCQPKLNQSVANKSKLTMKDIVLNNSNKISWKHNIVAKITTLCTDMCKNIVLNRFHYIFLYGVFITPPELCHHHRSMTFEWQIRAIVDVMPSTL